MITLELQPEEPGTAVSIAEESLEAWVQGIQEKLLFLRKRLKDLRNGI